MIAPRQFKRPSVMRSTRSPGSASGICRTASTISLGVDAVPGGIGTTAVQRNRGHRRRRAIGCPEIRFYGAEEVVSCTFVSRGSVVQVRGRLWMLGVRDIQHHKTGVLLPRPVLRRIVGAVIQERWSILRKRPLSLELADEFQVAVVATFRLAARTLIRGGLTLQSGFGSIHATTCGLGHRRCPWDGLSDRALPDAGLVGRCNRSPEQQCGRRDGCNGEC